MIDVEALVLGDRVRTLRLEAGLSQRQLAEGLDGVSLAFVSRIERGERRPSERTLRAIADRLDTTAHELETGSTKGVCPHCGSKL
jgi:transcriptional regulator with XRE-family HTH domain